MDKTNELVESNKNIYESNLTISQHLTGAKVHSNNNSIKNINIQSPNNLNSNATFTDSSQKNKEVILHSNKSDNRLTKIEVSEYNSYGNTKLPITNSFNYNTKDYNSIDDNKMNEINKNKNISANNNILEIKISNSVLKKDITGKPYLDYICEIKNGNDSYSINKKFGHFIMLHKNLKNIFKETIKLPDGGNLFISINDMKQNTFHENKLSQLDKYINELMKIEQVKNSLIFRNFFELDEQHEQNNNNNKIKKNKTMMEKKKYTKYSSNNALQKVSNDYINDFTNIK